MAQQIKMHKKSCAVSKYQMQQSQQKRRKLLTIAKTHSKMKRNYGKTLKLLRAGKVSDWL